MGDHLLQKMMTVAWLTIPAWWTSQKYHSSHKYRKAHNSRTNSCRGLGRQMLVKTFVVRYYSPPIDADWIDSVHSVGRHNQIHSDGATEDGQATMETRNCKYPEPSVDSGLD